MLFVCVAHSSVHVLLYILATWRVSHKRQERLTLREHLSSPPVYWWGPCCSPIMCLYVLSSVLWYLLRFPHKTMFGWYLPPVLCMSFHVLFTIFVLVCVYWCPTHIVLCAFSLRLVHPMLPVSKDCQISGWPNQYSLMFL